MFTYRHAVYFLSIPTILYLLVALSPSSTSLAAFISSPKYLNKAGEKHQIECPYFAGEEDVQIIVKTGANEIYKKLPTQLLTSLRCYSPGQVLLFSDLEQVIGRHHINDVLANVTASVKKSSHFDYYRRLQALNEDGQDPTSIEVEGNAAWNLDKFKFLHMLEKTWEARPDKKWYVFIEADTYLVRSNLLNWLRYLKAYKALYLGSPVVVGDETFAHGGSGVILSGVALKKFAANDPGIAARFDEEMQKLTYGDQGLMRGLKAKGVELTGKWPILQGETPATYPYGSGGSTPMWCQPVVTMHHIAPDEASRFWEFEQGRADKKKPILVHEIYETLIAPHIIARHEDWDNVSNDVNYRPPGVAGDRQKKAEEMSTIEKAAYLSFENCRSACEEQKKCYQFLYQSPEKLCSLSHSFRLGARRKMELGKTSEAGWLVERIDKFRESHVCRYPKWF